MEDTFTLKSGYAGNREPEKTYRLMSWLETSQLHYGQHVEVIDLHDQVRTVKINGSPKTWKTRPGNVSIPWKYGMYEYGTTSYAQHEHHDGPKFIIEVSEV